MVKLFERVLTLFDDPSTREKVTVMDKWEAMTDDERNPDFEGLDDFLEWGKKYRITVEDVTEGPKLRVVMTHEYTADPANYPVGSTPAEMMEIDRENGYADLLCDYGSDNFDVDYEWIE